MKNKQITVDRAQLETARQDWAKVAKENGWYTEPFYVQVWVDKKGNVVDSVSFRNIISDIIERV